ncbi:amidohydrolase family protein [Aeromicrobium sp.]|uniref:amidohydrolase family protein n=1 Tax=Aeromicrobium sp. TaxID=1871063 RepID=UPI0030C12FD2
MANLFERSGTAEALKHGVVVDDVLKAMDNAGVERLLLSAWHRPGGWVLSNDEVAEVVSAHPDRFTGIAAVDLEHPMAAIAELDRAITVLGFVGLRVVPWLWDRPPDDRLYYPLYAKCVALGVPFCTQVGHTGPAMPSEPGRPVPYLDRVALDFPDLTIVAGHIGHPWTEEMIGLAWKHANVYIDTSAHAPRYYPPALVHFAATYGQTKVLFGSNFPQLPIERCADEARQLDLPPAALENFLSENARGVFKL